LFLQPVTKLHLHHDHLLFVDPSERPGDILYVRVFALVALSILLLACINFVTLSSSRMRARAKEVALRKTLGASRADIATQFFGESMILAGIAFAVSLIVVELALPVFRMWAQKNVSLLSGGDFPPVIGLSVLVLGTGLISGMYPAFSFASITPIEALHEQSGSPGQSRLFRRLLVIFQYAITIALLLMTLVMNRQLAYVEARDLGFEIDRLVHVPLSPGIADQYETFRDRLLRDPTVIAVARGNLPLNAVTGTYRWSWPGKDPRTEFKIHPMRIDFDYVETLKLDVIEGRSFSREYGTDAEAAYMINEAAARTMGMASPLGKELTLWNTEGTIIGLVRDFHYGSLHHSIGPVVFHVNPCGHSTRFGSVCIRLAGDNADAAVASLRDIWKDLAGEDVFQWSLLNDTLRAAYGDERKLQTLFTLFVCLSSFISGLGLLGLTLFTTERRTKEVGIRKVLGASVSDIIILLSSQFVRLVSLAMLIAFPVAYVSARWWLGSFAYRTQIHPHLFAIAGGAALVLGVLVTTILSIRTATKNPVRTLRYE
jgi:putative ABC transport system permease protein